uniref:Uncharacterized protein n=1 Tax=Leishmania donovani TaxID=5661 RepID=Q950V2_LEIDO|nr:unknown [Leishmania donovani]
MGQKCRKWPRRLQTGGWCKIGPGGPGIGLLRGWLPSKVPPGGLPDLELASWAGFWSLLGFDIDFLLSLGGFVGRPGCFLAAWC